MRNDIHLAPNAIVFLNHLCYAAGNGEEGMAIPTWDIAHQRNDNFAAGFLASGARTVFAYSWQTYIKALRDLMTTDKSMKEIFETPGSAAERLLRLDRHRRAGARLRPNAGHGQLLDRDPKNGFLRAVSGDLSMTAGQWRGEELADNLPTINAPPVGPTAPAHVTGAAYNGRYVRLTWDPATMTHYGTVRYLIVRSGKSVGTWPTTTYWTTVRPRLAATRMRSALLTPRATRARCRTR